MGLSNQFPSASDFNTASKCSDSVKLTRVTMLKKVHPDGFVPWGNYDSGGYIDVTAYLVKNGIGDIVWGLDDQDFLSGVYRNANVSLEFDNTEGKFNDPSAYGSLWWDLPFYGVPFIINGTIIKIEFGFRAPDGTEYWDEFFSGTIDEMSLDYTTNNSVKLDVLSKLNWFNGINMYQAVSFERIPGASARALMDCIYTYSKEHCPAELGLEFNTNSPRRDIYYTNVEKVNKNVFKLFQSFAKQTGSVFGVNRKNQVFLTYYDNPNAQYTMGGLQVDTSTVALWEFDTAGAMVDQTGHTYDLNTIDGSPVQTYGKFGTGIEYQDSYHASMTYSLTSLCTGSYSIEWIWKINRKNNTGTYFGSRLESMVQFIDSQVAVNGLATIDIGNDSDDILNMNGGTPYSTGWNYSLVDVFGENQWYYCCVNNDAVRNIRSFMVNGVTITTAPSAVSLSTAWILFGVDNGAHKVEFDCARFSNRIRTDQEMVTQTERLYGNEIYWNPAPKYGLYNYGPNQNVMKLLGYDPGIKKMFNRVVVHNDKVNQYDIQFDCDFSAMTLTVWWNNNTYGPTAINTATGMQSFINAISPGKIFCTITGAALTSIGGYNIRIGCPSMTAAQMITAKMQLMYNAAGKPWRTAADSKYLVLTKANAVPTRVDVFNFCRVYTQKDYVFDDTASVARYGAHEYNVEDDDTIETDFFEVQAMAESILDNSAWPKARMKLRCTFLEGNLDLLDKVTVNWKNPYIGNAPMVWDEDAWDVGEWATVSNNITWSTKDFYVIGITHSDKGNYSDYVLREV